MCWKDYLATEAIWEPGLYWLIVALDSMGIFLCQITVCSQIVVLDQREGTKQVGVTGELLGQLCDLLGWVWLVLGS